jgi:hypothetical protein
MEIAKEEAEQREQDTMHALESVLADKLAIQAELDTLRAARDSVESVRADMTQELDAVKVRFAWSLVGWLVPFPFGLSLAAFTFPHVGAASATWGRTFGPQQPWRGWWCMTPNPVAWCQCPALTCRCMPAPTIHHFRAQAEFRAMIASMEAEATELRAERDQALGRSRDLEQELRSANARTTDVQEALGTLHPHCWRVAGLGCVCPRGTANPEVVMWAERWRCMFRG